MRASAGFGRIERWDDARGFGFITSEAPVAGMSGPLFFHIHDVDRTSARPRAGARMRFTPERQRDGRWRAVRVATVDVVAPRDARARSRRRDAERPARAVAGLAMSAATIAWAALLVGAIAIGQLPPGALAALAGLNALTFIVYAFDKRAARQGRQRTPEMHLHLLELLGGWPAATLAQQTLRHKRAKPDYRRVFALMIVVHLLGLAAWTFA